MKSDVDVIKINGKVYSFKENFEFGLRGPDLEIIERGFNEKTSTISEQFTNCRMEGIYFWLKFRLDQIKYTYYLDPCAKVYLDSKGRKKLTAYFD